MPRRFIIPLLLLMLGCASWYVLGRPVAKPEPKALPPQVLKTEIREMQPQDYTILLETQGIVRAHHETSLTPQVAGVICAISPRFEDGAIFEKDEVLLELDAADFQMSLAAAQAKLARAEATLLQEKARAEQARLNWQDIGYQDEPSPLVLRVPQLKDAEAQVQSAQAELEQAQRNLERTKVRAPFAGRVKNRLVGLGQSVSGNTALGNIFDTDCVDVRLPLSPAQWRQAILPETTNHAPIRVTLTDALGDTVLENPTSGTPATATPAEWTGQIIRAEGVLDDASRQLFVIARVDDPFGRRTARKQPLRIGQPVRARIEGRTLQQVFIVPRSALRGINRCYLVDGDPAILVRRDLQPVWTTETELVLSEGIRAGEQLAISRLPYAPEGARVEILPSPPVATPSAPAPAQHAPRS